MKPILCCIERVGIRWLRNVRWSILALLLLPLCVNAADPAPNTNGYFNVWTGAKIENPYTISVDPVAKTATLQPSKTTTDGFIEFNFNYRYVLRHGTVQEQDPFIWDAGDSHRITNSPGAGQFIAPWIHFPDLDTSVGYVFRGSSASTNFSASTIAGGSDLYVEGALGFPWWRYVDDNGPIRKMQATFEVAGGVVTDKNNLLLHPNIFLGGGFQGAYVRNGSGGPLLGLWSGRIGMAQVDQPRILSGSSVALNGLNEPVFDATWVPSLGFDITVPVTTVISGVFGGNVYFTDNPASWNMSVGISLDIDKFFNAMK
jgi:hypothetical protein